MLYLKANLRGGDGWAANRTLHQMDDEDNSFSQKED